MKVTVPGGVVTRLLEDVKIPKMFYAKQSFTSECIPANQISSVVFEQLGKPQLAQRIRPNTRIAITAGSRGIANVDIITKAVVDFVRTQGAHPFIVPAMGSHGGATAEGQLEILAGYGITPERMGCPIHSSMETVYLGESLSGRPVYIDKNAFESDGIIVSCRLKPHNAFRGSYESGPCKMLAIGLGKQKGAENCHADGMGKIGMHIPSIAQIMLEKAPVLLAIPCIENAYDQTCRLEAIAAEDVMTREPELLKFAFSQMPHLLVGEADVLVVDEIGKNYSGTGVDPNVTGTFSTEFAHGGIQVQRTCFLDLSDASHGNSLGVGLSNAITQRLFDKIDMNAMYPNCITSTVLSSARIPCVMPSDLDAVRFCIRTTNGIDPSPDKLRMVRIPNSLHIGEIMLSEAYYADVNAGKYPQLFAMGEPAELLFDTQGNLLTPSVPVNGAQR